MKFVREALCRPWSESHTETLTRQTLLLSISRLRLSRDHIKHQLVVARTYRRWNNHRSSHRVRNTVCKDPWCRLTSIRWASLNDECVNPFPEGDVYLVRCFNCSS